METKEPNSVLKTPRRTRKTSVEESLKSPALLLTGEYDERKDPVTPGRSTRTLDFRTPSRTESLAAVQTPRRSCRKSIKPIQEYENIVAQKGLSAKRLLTDPTPSEEIEEEASSTIEIRQNKWAPADIGRVSTKRSKKKRNKNKRLERQKNIVVVEEDDKIEIDDQIAKSDDNLDRNELLDDEREKNVSLEEKIEIKIEDKIAKLDDYLDCNELDDKKEKNVSLEEIIKMDEDIVAKEEENKDVETLSTDLTTPDIQIENETNNLVQSDDSMEEGDVILNAMPVTGDDCIQSPEKPLEQNLKYSVSATPVVESANKSDDSDCIMLSLNDSSQSRQSVCQKPTFIAVESKMEANESSDSMGINMPPLLVCSDDEDEEGFVDLPNSPDGTNPKSPIDKIYSESNEPDPLNGTFTSKENIEEHFFDTEMCPVDEQSIDTVLRPEEIRKIVLGIEEQPEVTISSAPEDEQKISPPLNGTFDADESPTETINTPKSVSTQSSGARILTPFKTDKPIIPDINIEPEEEDFEEPPFFVYEPRENILKSSRKRSFSFCVDRPKKNVTFHSPSNRTMNIYHGDQTKSATKRTPANITKRRRKRSLSVTETERDLMDYIQMKKPTNDATPKKKQQSKIKMPNFSNIHQKQFQRMESIADHVARKTERAKILINSNTKIKPASVPKGLPVKTSVLRDHNKDGNKSQLPMPKARQRIDMSELENKTKTDVTNSLHTKTKALSKSKQDLRLLDDLAVIGKTPTKVSANSTSLFKQNNCIRLPKPRFNFNFNSTTVPTCANATVSSMSHRLVLPNPREHFNLSTTIAPTRQAPKVDKLEDRRKRMMDMFKSKSSHKVGENKKDILKGVRTNRRFELQMMCRNRQN